MNNLLRLLKRFQHVLYFLLLEVVALTLYINYNYYQKAQASLVFRRVESYVEAWRSRTANYFRLEEENQRLVRENLELRNALENNRILLRHNPTAKIDSALTGRYTVRSARVISNTTARTHNFFTLDQGSKNGVTLQMPVLSEGNVAGIVVAVSPRFSIAISLLNTDLKVSAKLARTGYFGSLSWDGISHQTALLNEIPHHVEVRAGDSVVTSGYSNIFPAGIPIGLVESVENKGGDFSTLRIRLATDFKRIYYVTILQDNYRQELDSLQQQYEHHAE